MFVSINNSSSNIDSRHRNTRIVKCDLPIKPATAKQIFRFLNGLNQWDLNQILATRFCGIWIINASRGICGGGNRIDNAYKYRKKSQIFIANQQFRFESKAVYWSVNENRNPSAIPSSLGVLMKKAKITFSDFGCLHFPGAKRFSLYAKSH